MSEIRQASPDNGQWEERLEGLSSGGSGEISEVTVERLTVESKIDGYQFAGQEILYGQLVYSESHPFADREIETHVEFMYRPLSQLFILNTDQNDERDGEILRDIKGKLADEAEIHAGVGCSRKSTWDLIESASTVGQVRVLDEGSVVDIDQLELEIDDLRRKIVWDAELYFTDPESGDEKFVIYNEDSFHVDADSLRDIEFVIQIIEKHLTSE